MRQQRSVQKLTITALLIAMGIIIPFVMPKIIIGPASFTLASHVPLMVAMFFSPQMALAVALGTTFGFLLTSPFIIAARALSHVVFAWLGARYLQKNPQIVHQKKQFFLFNFVIALIHAVLEVLVVVVFLFWGQTTGTKIDGNLYQFFFGLMGVGGVIHSMIDYSLAFYIMQAISRKVSVPVFQRARINK